MRNIHIEFHSDWDVCFPAGNGLSSSDLASLASLLIFGFLHDGHSDRNEMGNLCSLDFYISQDSRHFFMYLLACWPSFEVSFQIVCPFIEFIIIPLVLIFFLLLYTFWILNK